MEEKVISPNTALALGASKFSRVGVEARNLEVVLSFCARGGIAKVKPVTLYPHQCPVAVVGGEGKG